MVGVPPQTRCGYFKTDPICPKQSRRLRGSLPSLIDIQVNT
jgi:hypothetical protein